MTDPNYDIKEVWVKRKHIQAGIREDGSSCPIALAIMEEYHIPEGCVSVVGYTIRVWRPAESNGLGAWCDEWRMPEEALSFVRSFDDYRPRRLLRPFRFAVHQNLPR